MRTHLAITFCCSLFIGSVCAETLYVDDKLVLNVYAEADQNSSRVATIETGDSVEEIERLENFVRVQLADGQEGWVSASYLRTKPPAIVRLRELDSSLPSAEANAATKQLSDEVARTKKQNAALQAEVAELKKKLTAAPATIASVPAALPMESSTESLTQTVTPDPTPEPVIVERTYWWVWLLGVVLAGAGGFFAGYQTLGNRVRARFGGVKVY
jgi:uncharacterized protein YgiM (DUF1202 family)